MSVIRCMGRVSTGLRFFGGKTAQVSRFLVPLSRLQFYSTTTDDIEQKYKEKLLKEAKLQGLNSIEDLKKHLKDSIDAKKLELNRIDPLKALYEYESLQKSNGKMTNLQPAIDRNLKKDPFKTLDSYFNIEKIDKLSNQEIEFLWRAKWAQKENILSAVISKEIYDRMYKYIKQNPSFVLPLPRKIEVDEEAKEKKEIEEGMELHYIQWHIVGKTTVHCMLTSLAEFKLHNQYARPHTTLELFTDLINDKQIILMKGSIEANSNIKPHDAQLLLLNIQRFYGALGEESEISKQRIKLLQNFTNGSSEFNVNTLISLAQSMEN